MTTGPEHTPGPHPPAGEAAPGAPTGPPTEPPAWGAPAGPPVAGPAAGQPGYPPPAGPPAYGPPAGPPAYGPPAGATAAGGYPPPGWAPGPPLPETRARRARPKALRIALPIAVAVVAGALRLSGVWGGADEPKVGDCVHTTGSSGTSFDVVSCTSKDAEYKVVGVDPAKETSKEFQADDNLCTSVPDTGVVLWAGTDPDKGTVYCAAPVGSAG